MNQAFESGAKSSGFSNGITRRSFLKRTGAASVATLVAFQLANEKANAEEENNDTDPSNPPNASEEKFLVCVRAPSGEELEAQPSVDSRVIDGPGGNDIVRRVKTDSLVASGVSKGMFVPHPGGFEYPISGIVTTILKLQQPDGNGGWVDIPNQTFERSATESQSVSSNDEEGIVFTAPAVVDGLEDSNGQSGALQGSAVSGGIAIDRGVLSAQTAWAGTEGGYSISLTVGVSPVSAKFDIAGTSVASTMQWSKPGLEWGFKIMTKSELDKWISENF